MGQWNGAEMAKSGSQETRLCQHWLALGGRDLGRKTKTKSTFSGSPMAMSQLPPREGAQNHPREALALLVCRPFCRVVFTPEPLRSNQVKVPELWQFLQVGQNK